jgi:hypothetical protein
MIRRRPKTLELDATGVNSPRLPFGPYQSRVALAGQSAPGEEEQ